MNFEDVYDKYSQDVFKFCFSLSGDYATAEDITSETFLKAIKASGTFKGDCSVKVWLYQIAKNTYYDYLRKHSKVTRLCDDLQSDNDFLAKVLDKDEAIRLHKLLHKLNAPYKEVFMLRVFAELSFANIGEIFSKTESWARVTFHRARLKFKESDIHGKM